MKLDITNWPTFKDEKPPADCTKIILYQDGTFYILDSSVHGYFTFIDYDYKCDNSYCYESRVLGPCTCKFKVTLDDKWIELPIKD